MAAPVLLSRKANGVTASQSPSDAPKATKVKPPAEGEKVVVRRLPPGMTEEEFVTILGDEWRVGNGKIAWVSYWPGKVSQQSVVVTPSGIARHALTHLPQPVEAV